MEKDVTWSEWEQACEGLGWDDLGAAGVTFGNLGTRESLELVKRAERPAGGMKGGEKMAMVNLELTGLDEIHAKIKELYAKIREVSKAADELAMQVVQLEISLNQPPAGVSALSDQVMDRIAEQMASRLASARIPE
ncbi:MAG: hypothetical protein NC489_39110 [Ruminococcus flavefaciens]|nr:hypothetical protein [Ruminococcus flavefaciens]